MHARMKEKAPLAFLSIHKSQKTQAPIKSCTESCSKARSESCFRVLNSADTGYSLAKPLAFVYNMTLTKRSGKEEIASLQVTSLVLILLITSFDRNP